MRAVLLRDLRLSLRQGGGFGLSLAFFLLVVALVPFGAGPDLGPLAAVAPGILWVAAILATLLSLDRLWALDMEDGSLPLLATAPLPLESAALAKAAAHWLATGLPLALAAAPLGLLLGLPPAAMAPLALSLLLGTPALSLIGAFAAALVLGLRRGGPLLPLLLLPLYLPTLLLGAESARRAAAGEPALAPFALLLAVTLLAAAAMPFAAAWAVRVNLR